MHNISVSSSDLPLHLDIRFDGTHFYNRKKITYTSRLKGIWTNGNISDNFPFTCGDPFNITIQEDSDRYKVCKVFMFFIVKSIKYCYLFILEQYSDFTVCGHVVLERR